MLSKQQAQMNHPSNMNRRVGQFFIKDDESQNFETTTTQYFEEDEVSSPNFRGISLIVWGRN
jgi:hypothetical protein